MSDIGYFPEIGLVRAADGTFILVGNSDCGTYWRDCISTHPTVQDAVAALTAAVQRAALDTFAGTPT